MLGYQVTVRKGFHFVVLFMLAIGGLEYLHQFLQQYDTHLHGNKRYFNKNFNKTLALKMIRPNNTISPSLGIPAKWPSIETNDNVNTRTRIAIAVALTSANLDIDMSKKDIVVTFPLFNSLLPSFCSTCSEGYSYHFYFAYDDTDEFFTKATKVKSFVNIFDEMVESHCSITIVTELHMIECGHSKHPAWAQNDAVMAAYLDNMDYFYRVNDDTLLTTAGWTETFIDALKKFDPPNVGVVGPHHHGDVQAFMTYEFTHHTHVDIFGFHYPRDFLDWYGDKWIDRLYKPLWSKVIHTVELNHTRQFGKRYRVQSHLQQELKKILIRNKAILQRYINHSKQDSDVAKDPTKVIVYLVYSNNVNVTMGALRNVQLATVIFPEWIVRIYTKKENNTNKVIHKMSVLGAEIHYKESDNYNEILLEIFNDKHVSVVLIRDPEHRLSDREKAAVDEWMDSAAVFHCMQDHPDHMAKSVIPGLFGMKTGMLSADDFHKLHDTSQNIPIEVSLQKIFSNRMLCHDSISCNRCVYSKPFPFVVERNGTRQFVGQRFDAFMVPVDKILDEDTCIIRKFC